MLGRITGLRAVSRPRWRPSRFPGHPPVHVAVTRESAQPGGDTPSGQPGWQAMAAKLGTPDGRALYKQRRAIIESVFAQLFARFGRTLRYRGDMVTIHLWAAVHSMLNATAPAARPANAPPSGPPRPSHSIERAGLHRANPPAARKTPGNGTAFARQTRTPASTRPRGDQNENPSARANAPT